MSKLFTVQAYSLVMFISSTLVLLVGFILWMNYDGNVYRSIGLRQSIAELLAASMLPVILINLIGFRDAAFSTIVNIGATNNKVEYIPIKSGGIFLYSVGLLGVICALTCIFFLSGDIDPSRAKITIAFTAAIWGGTTGVVFDKYFKQYTIQK